MKALALLLSGLPAWAQTGQTANPGFRLAYVRTIYIESLGDDYGARVVHDQLAGALVNRTKLLLQTSRSDADAAFTGNATTTSEKVQWSSASAAASATATRADSAARAGAGSGTIHLTWLGLQLTDRYGQILWAYDGTRCIDMQMLILVG